MSWQPEVFIGELRPWPDSVLVIKGASDERKRYVPEKTCQFVVIDQDHSPKRRGDICECDSCGYRCAWGFIVDERFKHCPGCGAKVVEQ